MQNKNGNGVGGGRKKDSYVGRTRKCCRQDRCPARPNQPVPDMSQGLQRRDPLQDPHRARPSQAEEGRLREVPGNVSDQTNFEDPHFKVPWRHQGLKGLPQVRAVRQALRD